MQLKINDHSWTGCNHEPIKIHKKYELGMDPQRNKHLQCIFLVSLSSCSFFREQKLSENQNFRLPLARAFSGHLVRRYNQHLAVVVVVVVVVVQNDSNNQSFLSGGGCVPLLSIHFYKNNAPDWQEHCMVQNYSPHVFSTISILLIEKFNLALKISQAHGVLPGRIVPHSTTEM